MERTSESEIDGVDVPDGSENPYTPHIFHRRESDHTHRVGSVRDEHCRRDSPKVHRYRELPQAFPRIQCLDDHSEGFEIPVTANTGFPGVPPNVTARQSRELVSASDDRKFILLDYVAEHPDFGLRMVSTDENFQAEEEYLMSPKTMSSLQDKVDQDSAMNSSTGDRQALPYGTSADNVRNGQCLDLVSRLSDSPRPASSPETHVPEDLSLKASLPKAEHVPPPVSRFFPLPVQPLYPQLFPQHIVPPHNLPQFGVKTEIFPQQTAEPNLRIQYIRSNPHDPLTAAYERALQQTFYEMSDPNFMAEDVPDPPGANLHTIATLRVRFRELEVQLARTIARGFNNKIFLDVCPQLLDPSKRNMEILIAKRQLQLLQTYYLRLQEKHSNYLDPDPPYPDLEAKIIECWQTMHHVQKCIQELKNKLVSYRKKVSAKQPVDESEAPTLVEYDQLIRREIALAMACVTKISARPDFLKPLQQDPTKLTKPATKDDEETFTKDQLSCLKACLERGRSPTAEEMLLVSRFTGLNCQVCSSFPEQMTRIVFLLHVLL